MKSPVKPIFPLRQQYLDSLAGRLRVPHYVRGERPNSIVHIGVGGFFRSHLAAYLDDLLSAQGGADWMLYGVTLLPHDVAIGADLRAQDCLYTLVERSAEGAQARVIGSLAAVLHGPDDPEAVLAKLTDPACKIVSLTITEGGYYLDQGSGQFDADHPDIVAALAQPQQPRCSFAYLATALERRRLAGLAPFTIMSCDNLQGNGDLTRRMLLAYIGLYNADLAAWLAREGAFPNSMVDRITPATTDVHRAWVRERYGIDDARPVMTEPFRQWVLEDKFPLGRPRWEQAGASLSTQVYRHETLKLRVLNASHQVLCYLGMLLGYTYAHEAIQDPQVRLLVTATMEREVLPLLPAIDGVDPRAYLASVLVRLANPSIRDQLERIGTDGSARMPKFVLPSVQAQLASGGSIELLSFAVACWFRFLAGHDEQGGTLPLTDPLAATLREHALRGGPEAGALLSLERLFGPLSHTPAFADAVGRALRRLYGQGVAAALHATLAAPPGAPVTGL
ncbi:MAG TPA: mannitol dehydrogenase family protein [Burkholderiaceae bacterium]|nr:mannitol dehydrogenase family protein [Burkholderiaceae bacterium]